MAWYSIITRNTKKGEKCKDGEKTDLKNVKRNIEIFFILCGLIFSL